MQKGLVYDLVRVCFIWDRSGWGKAGSVTENELGIWKIPVEREEIISRLKQMKGQHLRFTAFSVENLPHSVIDRRELVGQVREWLEEKLNEQAFILKVKGLLKKRQSHSNSKKTKKGKRSSWPPEEGFRPNEW